MDRVISKEEIKKIKRTKIILYLSIGLIVVLLINVFLSLFKPTLNRNDILTTDSFRGSIEETVFSIGTIIPLFEESIISPIETKVNRLNKSIGSKVHKNESILEVDKTQIRSTYNKMKDEYQLKLNKKYQLNLKLERELIELSSQLDIKTLEIESLKAKKAQEDKLFKIGAGSQESYQVASLNLQISERQKSLLENKIDNRKKTLTADLNELELETQIQKRRITEIERTLEQSEIKSSISGILTWVEESIGKRISVGDVVAKVTQDKAFKLKGELSESNASKVFIGQEVIFELNDKKYTGEITSINPSVSNGVITYIAKIPDGVEGLRANLNLDTHLVLSKKENAILLKVSSTYTGESEIPLYVIDGNIARKRTVKTGISNYNYIELKSSIKENETIIISNMEDYYHMNEIEIK